MTVEAPRFPHRHRFRIRYAETDAAGIVYYGNYLTFFEVGRVEYLRAVGPGYASWEDRGIVAAVIAASVRYVAPARFDDLLTICTRVSELGKVRFQFEYEIWREDDSTLIASGHTEHVLLRHGSLRPIRIPEEARLAIEHFEAASRE